jgi:ATP-dependent helicase Lhr and Lhr-like helicase
LTGLDGLREAVSMFDGFELAAGAWERSVLPCRVEGYESSMLDMLCLAGEVAWGRLSVAGFSPGSGPQLVPATPVALFLRAHADAWQSLRPVDGLGEETLTAHARVLLETLRARGASFLTDLATACSLDRDQVRHAMGSLAACGLARSDGFSGLRTLLWTATGTPVSRDRSGQFAGRWAAVGGGRTDAHDAAVETQAWALLRRYGIVFRRLLARETNAAPWRELARFYRRLEARGEIRGGRFVSGMSGEQFAVPEAIDRMREVRRTAPDGRLVTISTADPLNLVGIITAGERIRAAGRNTILWRDGVPLAVKEGDFLRELAPIDPAIAADVSRALSGRSSRYQVPVSQ